MPFEQLRPALPRGLVQSRRSCDRVPSLGFVAVKGD